MTCRPCSPTIINDKGNHVVTIVIRGTMGIAGTMVEGVGIIKGMIVDMADQALGIKEDDSVLAFV